MKVTIEGIGQTDIEDKYYTDLLINKIKALKKENKQLRYELRVKVQEPKKCYSCIHFNTITEKCQKSWEIIADCIIHDFKYYVNKQEVEGL
jgi:hypothetical protein